MRSHDINYLAHINLCKLMFTVFLHFLIKNQVHKGYLMSKKLSSIYILQDYITKEKKTRIHCTMCL